MTQKIECLAAIALEPNKPLTVGTILVDPPKPGEVRVKVLVSALCATDKYTLDGHDPEGVFPCILGHEGAGIVEDIGDGVTTVKKGDHVIPCYVPQCRKCDYCMNPNTNLCSVIRETQGKGLMPDNTTRFSLPNGQKIFHFMGTSVFSQYIVLPEIAVAKIDETAPMEKVCLLSCGVATGLGAVKNNAKVTKGSTSAIWGAGAVGLAALMECKKIGCSRIFVIDTNPEKEKLARQLGATDFINPKTLPPETTVKDYMIKATNGGPDFTFECVGHVDLMREALESCHKGWGVSTIIGVAASGQEIKTRPFQLVTGRTWKGSAFGGWKSRDDVPKLVKQVVNKELDLDPFITGSYPLRDINKAVDLMSQGKGIRTIIKMWE